MCASCDGYEYSKSCGPLCTDHNYKWDEVLSDDEDDFYCCKDCGCVK